MSKNSPTLNLIGPVNFTGYGTHFINFATNIAHLWKGKVVIEHIGDVQPGINDSYIKQYYGKADEKGISIKIWHDHDLKMPGKYKIGYTVFELDVFERETDIAKRDVIDEVWVPSKWAKKAVETHQNALNANIPVSVVPEGVDERLFSHQVLPASFPYAINVGKFEKRKGHLDIIDIWEDIDMPIFCLWANQFVPPHIITTELAQRGWKSREAINHFGISFINFVKPGKTGSIKVCFNFVPQENYIKLVKNAYVGIFPYYAEGWNLPLCEAMSCGVPCVASNNTGPQEYINKDNCFIIDKFTEELAVDNIFFRSKEATWMVPDKKWLKIVVANVTNPDQSQRVIDMRQGLKNFGANYSWNNAANVAVKRLNDIVKEL
jgi:glycosyltransferase involved in cell wall biosynthesis